MLTYLKISALFLLSFNFYGCDPKTLVEPVSEEILNSMSVTLNDSSYVLTSVAGSGAYEMTAPTIRGTLLGKYLYVNLKNDDTVSVGSTYSIAPYTVIYTITFDTCHTIKNSGRIGSVSYFDGKAYRSKGFFSFDAISGKDTLRFRDGHFDVYLTAQK